MQRDETYKKRDNQKTSRGKDKKYIDAKEDPQEYRLYDFSQDDTEEDENCECISESLECDKKAEDSGVDPGKDKKYADTKDISSNRQHKDDLKEYEKLLYDPALRRFINEELSAVSLIADAHSFKTGTQNKSKLIFVEGSTDTGFYGRYINSEIKVRDVGNIFKTSDDLKSPANEKNSDNHKSVEEVDVNNDNTNLGLSANEKENNTISESKEANNRPNNKNIVIRLIMALSIGKLSEHVTIPCEISEHFEIYGIIDKDFDEDDKYIFLDKLFVTDTHDLETLMLSTDTDLVYHLENCKITKDDYDKALFMAYQLGEIKQRLHRLKGLPNKTSKLKINNQFCREGILKSNPRVKLENVIEVNSAFVEKENKKSNDASGGVGKEIKEKQTRDMKEAERAISECLEGRFDDNGDWKVSFGAFCQSVLPNLSKSKSKYWNLINGHDIVDAINWVKQGSTTKWDDIKENDLIKAYDHDKFYTTTIAKRMQKACLI